MKLDPARQEKQAARAKRSPREEQMQTAKKAQAKASTKKTSEEVKIETPPVTNSPVFVRRNLTAPDGSVRPGWEMWIGEHCFGRADSKELLLASFERLQSPPSSFHWREVRNRMPMRGRPRVVEQESTDSSEEKEKSWEWENKDEEALPDEVADGFQELSWDTPS